MATHIGSNETLPQIVITPNKGQARHGADKNGTVGRTLPQDIRENATVLGKGAEGGNKAQKGENGFWGEDGFTFGDLIDLINPLQHIPVVSTIYRAVTGDEIAPGPRMIGGALLGGVVGFSAAAVSAAIENETGKDIGDHALVAMGLADDADVSIAAKRAKEEKATLLSSADPLSSLIVQEAEELAQSQPNMTKAEAMEAAQLAAGISPINLKAPTPAGDERANWALGGMEVATQRYQQAQMMDKLQTTALGMDING